jgi:hypothetical protein
MKVVKGGGKVEGREPRSHGQTNHIPKTIPTASAWQLKCKISGWIELQSTSVLANSYVHSPIHHLQTKLRCPLQTIPVSALSESICMNWNRWLNSPSAVYDLGKCIFPTGKSQRNFILVVLRHHVVVSVLRSSSCRASILCYGCCVMLCGFGLRWVKRAPGCAILCYTPSSGVSSSQCPCRDCWNAGQLDKSKT